MFKMVRFFRNARLSLLYSGFGHETKPCSPGVTGGLSRGMATGVEWLNSLVNYEQIGVPENAGGDSDLGFPMVCFLVCGYCCLGAETILESRLKVW